MQTCLQLEYGTGVIIAIETFNSDIIMLLDIRMPNIDGLAVMDEQKVLLPTMLLTVFDEHELVFKCMKLGARDYLRKDVSSEAFGGGYRSRRGG